MVKQNKQTIFSFIGPQLKVLEFLCKQLELFKILLFSDSITVKVNIYLCPFKKTFQYSKNIFLSCLKLYKKKLKVQFIFIVTLFSFSQWVNSSRPPVFYLLSLLQALPEVLTIIVIIPI